MIIREFSLQCEESQLRSKLQLWDKVHLNDVCFSLKWVNKDLFSLSFEAKNEISGFIWCKCEFMASNVLNCKVQLNMLSYIGIFFGILFSVGSFILTGYATSSFSVLGVCISIFFILRDKIMDDIDSYKAYLNKVSDQYGIR